jgi:hypothetical protein
MSLGYTHLQTPGMQPTIEPSNTPMMAAVEPATCQPYLSTNRIIETRLSTMGLSRRASPQ